MVQLARKIAVVKLAVVIMFDVHRGKRLPKGVEQRKQKPYDNATDS